VERGRKGGGGEEDGGGGGGGGGSSNSSSSCDNTNNNLLLLLLLLMRRTNELNAIYYNFHIVNSVNTGYKMVNRATRMSGERKLQTPFTFI
jgi:hypothetical protein